MKARFAISMCCILPALPAMVFANVTGVVRNDASKPVPKVFVRFVNASDSTLEASTFTDSLGRYSLSLPGGVGVTRQHGVASSAVSLEQNRPNPVCGKTAISYYLPGKGVIELAIVSLNGQVVDRISQYAAAGRNAIIWRPPSSLPGGVYVYRLLYNGIMMEKTMIVSGGALSGTQGTRGGSSGGSSSSVNSLSKGTASKASGYNVLVYGRGVYPYKASGVSLTEGTTRDFSLKYVDLWDSCRIILRDSMVNSRYQFQKTKVGRVVFLGGSITYNPGWRDTVTKYLQTRFPQTAFTFVNAGIPSVGSNMHAFRAKRDIFSSGKIDLLFVEAAVNDTTNNISNNINKTVRLRAFEGIFRQARAHNANIDIVCIHMADDVFYPSVKSCDSIPFLDSYERPAWHYGVSTINLAQYVAERYTWAQFGANVHPQDTGIANPIYGRELRRIFDEAWKDSLPAAAQITKHFHPARLLDTLCYQYGHYDSIATAQLVAGWTSVASWKPTDGVGTRSGFVNVSLLQATAAGAKLTFSFTGTAVGIVSPEGPDAGIINYQIDNTITGALDQYTQWSSALYIPWIWMFATDLANTRHTLTCTIANTKNSASTGYASRIMEFAVNGQ
jgi:sialidase-1